MHEKIPIAAKAIPMAISSHERREAFEKTGTYF